MELPNIQRGMQILADHINAISREVRANAVTSFVGGKFQRTTGGTSLQIDPAYLPVTSAANVPCPFRLTDVSTDTEKKIQIEQRTVSTNTGFRWPDGMGPGFPPYVITITQTSYIYVKFAYVPNDVIVSPGSDGVTIAVEPELKSNEVNDEYVLIGIALINGDAMQLTSQCENVTNNPCNLNWV